MRAIAIVLILAACQPTPPPAPPVPGAMVPSGETVMTVNQIPITQSMVDAVTGRIPPEQFERMQTTPGHMDRFMEQMAVGQVLYEAAIAGNLHQDPSVQEGLAMAQREYLAGVWVQRKGEEAVTDATIQEYYESHKVQFARPQVNARHILVKEESLAIRLKGEVDAGGDFAALAKEHSTDKGSGQAGGDLGWFEKGRMVEAFSDAAFAAEKGDIVGPVNTRFGFHVIQVLDKRSETALEDVRSKIVNSVRQEGIQSYMDEVSKTMKVDRPGDDGANTTAEGAGSAPGHAAGAHDHPPHPGHEKHGG